MRWLLGSSFYEGGRGGVTARQLFTLLWRRNNLAADAQPTRTVVVCEGNSHLGFSHPDVDVVHLSGDLGHCGHLLKNEKPHEFSSWSASMVALAMLAYDDEADFIYKESDCLAFGPWVRQMYADMGDRDIVFGKAMRTAPYMPCAQSLFLVRHRFIPTLVSEYLALGGDRTHETLGEKKFCMIERKHPDRVAKLSFGIDRERPIPWDASVWYAQQWTEEEISELQRRGLA